MNFIVFFLVKYAGPLSCVRLVNINVIINVMIYFVRVSILWHTEHVQSSASKEQNLPVLL